MNTKDFAFKACHSKEVWREEGGGGGGGGGDSKWKDKAKRRMKDRT